jgi:hypothetical protein
LEDPVALHPHATRRTSPSGRGGGRAAAVIRLPDVILVTVGGYLAILTAAAWSARRAGAARTAMAATPTCRFVVLIPAHNEERLIGTALDSLAALDYPADLRTTHVVADNCTDATATIVRGRGVEAHERDAPEDGGKGPALQWLLSRLRDRGDPYDAVVIIDADSTVSTNFLTVMDAKLRAGAEVVQSYYAVRDADQSSTAAFRAAALAVRHYLRPLGRTRLGGSAGLHGNGMVFRSDVLESHAWTNHLTEDIELQLELLVEGTSVAFAPDAVVEAEMPTTLASSRSQHERWERGRLEMARRYVPRLLRCAGASRGWDRVGYLDAALDQLLPPFSVTVAATAAWATLTTVVAVGRRRGRPGVRVAVAAAVVLVQASYVVSGLLMVSAPAAVYRSLLRSPQLVLWKVRLWLGMIGGRRNVAWVRTARNADLARDPSPTASLVAVPSCPP